MDGGAGGVVVLWLSLSWGAPGADAPVAPDVHAEAVDTAVRTLTLRYAHQDHLGVDWGARLVALRAAPLSATDFADAIAPALAEARDPELTVGVGGAEPRPAWTPEIRPNADPEALRNRTPTPLGAGAGVGEADGLPYLVVTDWDAADASALHGWLDEHCYGPLIVDVRLARGGTEAQVRRVARRFVSRATVYARQRTRRPDGSWGPSLPRSLRPRRTPCTGRAAVLTGPAADGATEAFLWMMRAAGATLVGEASSGRWGNPRAVRLPNGVVLGIPTWDALDPAEAPIHGVGIVPDAVVAWADDGDPVLAEAVERLTR